MTTKMATAVLATVLLTGTGLPEILPSASHPDGDALASAPTAQEVVDGTWSARIEGDGEAHLRLTRWSDHEADWRYDSSLRLSDARAVVEAALRRDGVVETTLERAAGTLRLEGRIRDDRGRGEFTFRADPAFQDRMEALGLERPDADELFAAAVHAVDRERVTMLRELGFRPDFDDVLATAIFEVDRPFIQEARARWGELELDDLMAVRIHGVTDAFVEELRGLGLDLAELDDALAFRIHGITPDFVRGARELELGALDADDLLSMKIHGVDAEFVESLADAGFPLSDLDDALAFRIHGITAEWVEELRAEGFSELDADDLLKIRIHGLDDILRKRRPGG